MHKEEGHNIAEISRLIGCARQTVMNYVNDDKVKDLTYTKHTPITIDIHDDKSLETVLVKSMKDGRAQEATSAVMAALRLRAEQSAGNPAAEPMTEDEDVEFKRYLREDVYNELCDGCRDKAVIKQIGTVH